MANFGQHVKKIVTDYADLIFANELEAAAYTGMRDPQASLEKIVQDCANACVTCSENGSYIHYGGETCYVPAFATQPVDLTGAGDMYAAGVLYGLSRQATPERCATGLPRRVLRRTPDGRPSPGHSPGDGARHPGPKN